MAVLGAAPRCLCTVPVWAAAHTALSLARPTCTTACTHPHTHATHTPHRPPPPAPQDVLSTVGARNPAGRLEDLSVHLCFICVLHLANEHGLVVRGAEGLDRLDLSNVPAGLQPAATPGSARARA